MRNKIIDKCDINDYNCPFPSRKNNTCRRSRCMAWIDMGNDKGRCGMVPVVSSTTTTSPAPPPPPRKVAPPPPREEARELRKYFGARKTNIFGTVSPTENDDD